MKLDEKSHSIGTPLHNTYPKLPLVYNLLAEQYPDLTYLPIPSCGSWLGQCHVSTRRSVICQAPTSESSSQTH
ncbi:MAG: hypothetical protein PUP91_01120 [Rhizonema sp. PD37]|nr:hypothetical protein [Rhizonema sp. PD37]